MHDDVRYYKRVSVCEKVAIQKMVSAGRGRRRRVKTVFKWQCRPSIRMINEGEYPIMNEIQKISYKLTIF
jgi:hypothetical protein